MSKTKTRPYPLQNREVSWLRFNERVLEEALDKDNPLLARLRFLTIFQTNLDEFFMIRVSGLMQQAATGVDVLSQDGLSPKAQLALIQENLRPVLTKAQVCLNRDVLPKLETFGIHIVNYADLSADEQASWNDWFTHHVYPILTPLSVGPTHPFPFISNLSMNLALRVTAPHGETRFARVKIPLDNLPRFVPISGSADIDPPVRLLPLEQLIAANLDKMFPGMVLSTPVVFRVTRDADIEIAEDEADDLLRILQEGIKRRRFGEAVRLEVEQDAPAELVEDLKQGLGLDVSAVYEVNGLLGVENLGELCGADLPELKYAPFVGHVKEGTDDIFATIRTGDVMLHHPFDAMAPLVEMIRAAARDPNVVAIKQTLYRTNGNSPIIAALEEAVNNGKQVAALVELKARFDEENNIVWARRLEQSGIHVVYGVQGLKTHSKLALVVRRSDSGELVRYAHIGTGNYNTVTARLYTDLGLMTCDPKITADVLKLFNHLTGFAEPEEYNHLLVAPRMMKNRILDFITRETAFARSGKPAHIILKCNSILDKEIIFALYRASEAGVQVDLLIRGICSLYPGRKGISENIRVRSVVGRFLEHSRVYWFSNDGEPLCYIGSADLMDRNLERRVETLVPILDPEIQGWMRDTFLQRYLDDENRTRLMKPDGSYARVRGKRKKGLKDVHLQFLADNAK